MAIKIPSATESGIGRKTPGAIPEGTPKFRPKIRTDMTLEILQAGTQVAGLVVSAQQAKQAKIEKVRHEEAKNNALIENIKLGGEYKIASAAIEAAPGLDIAGRDIKQEELRAEIKAKFLKVIPQEFQSDSFVGLTRIVQTDKVNYTKAREVQVRDKRVADMEILLKEVETFSSEYPGNEKISKEQARILIDDSTLSATDKVARKHKIENIIDNNAVNNALSLGDPQIVLDSLEEKTESGAWANHKGLSSKQRTEGIEQARDAVQVNNGFKIGNDLWDEEGPTDKFDLIDIEGLTETARKRAGTEEAAKAAVTRVRERAVLHNQARTALIASHEGSIWEARINGANLDEVSNMREFVELPAKNRTTILRDIEAASKRLSKGETRALKLAQIARADELRDNSVELRKLGKDGLLKELANGKITEPSYNSLLKMMRSNSVPALQLVEASKMLSQTKKDLLFDDDPIKNSSIYVEHVNKLNEFVALNPKADPIDFVDSMLNPVKESWIKEFLFKGFTALGLSEEKPSPGEPGLAVEKPSPGDVLHGYEFKGGDPSLPENWEKIE